MLRYYVFSLLIIFSYYEQQCNSLLLHSKLINKSLKNNIIINNSKLYRYSKTIFNQNDKSKFKMSNIDGTGKDKIEPKYLIALM